MSSSSASTLEKWIQKIQNSWLQVLVLVNKDTASTSAGVLISEFISLLQLLAVPGETGASLVNHRVARLCRPISTPAGTISAKPSVINRGDGAHPCDSLVVGA